MIKGNRKRSMRNGIPWAAYRRAWSSHERQTEASEKTAALHDVYEK
jgi:hypothetical protein